MQKGFIKMWRESRGFGFIEQDSGDSLFFHVSSVKSEDEGEIREGRRVEYEIGASEKGSCALNVNLI